MKIVTIVGARPQFIKAAPVSRALHDAGHRQFLVHTGQHYDYGMSQVFFDELGLPEPDINLGVGSGSHGKQTGQMLIGIEDILLAEKPDWVLVYGDTNSTLAGALAAIKLHIPLAHVEAGLRSYNREMPEEHNRVLTDHCSEMLFCPTQNAVENLTNEGIKKGIHLVGDTMYDAVLQFGAMAAQRSAILDNLGLEPKSYFLATVHRASNTDSPEDLLNILRAFAQIQEPIIFPLHPRTRKKVEEFGLLKQFTLPDNVRFIDPTGYLDTLTLEKNSRIIITDSGGVQKEAYFFSVPCVTLRTETEWVETVNAGWNMLAGADTEKILTAVEKMVQKSGLPPKVFGDGKASVHIATLIR